VFAKCSLSVLKRALKSLVSGGINFPNSVSRRLSVVVVARKTGSSSLCDSEKVYFSLLCLQ